MDLIWKETNKYFSISLSIKNDVLFIDDITITNKRKGTFTKFINYIINELHKINKIIIVAVGTIEMHNLMNKIKFKKINNFNFIVNDTEINISDYEWTRINN